MKHLNSIQLKKLYSDYVKYRDAECGGLADMSVEEFYLRNNGKYLDATLNQCDGCNRNLPIVEGIHRSMDGLPVMTCQAGLYA